MNSNKPLTYVTAAAVAAAALFGSKNVALTIAAISTVYNIGRAAQVYSELAKEYNH